MTYKRPTDGIDKTARQQIEGANDNRPTATHTATATPAAHPLVIIESPYGGDHERNVAYARVCLLDSLERGEAPIASHLLHTQVLDDDVPAERKTGIEAGLAWYRVADKCVVYAREGITKGMRAGMARAVAYGVPIEVRDEAEGEVAA